MSSYTEEVINNLFLGMHYAYLAGMNIGDDPMYAAIPKDTWPQPNSRQNLPSTIAEGETSDMKIESPHAH